MSRTLSDEDIELVAERVVALIGARFAAPSKRPEPAAAPVPEHLKPKELNTHRLAYSMKELCAELGLSPVSIYRLEMRGLLKSNPALRRKIYSRAEVERFLALDRKKW